MELYKGYYIEEVSDTPGLMSNRCIVYRSEEDMTYDIAGTDFTSIDDAKTWIDGQIPAPIYPDNIMQMVRQHLGLEEYDTSRDAEINSMTHVSVFAHCLEWEGIIGYEIKVLSWVRSIYGVDLS